MAYRHLRSYWMIQTLVDHSYPKIIISCNWFSDWTARIFCWRNAKQYIMVNFLRSPSITCQATQWIFSMGRFCFVCKYVHVPLPAYIWKNEFGVDTFPLGSNYSVNNKCFRRNYFVVNTICCIMIYWSLVAIHSDVSKKEK